MLTMVLVGAVLAALAVGVLAAYWTCEGFFRVMRFHAERERRGTAAVQVATEV